MRFVQSFFLLIVFSFSAAASDLRISAQSLSVSLSKYTVIDARPAALYEAQHIRGALNFPVALTYEDQASSGRVVNPEKIQNVLRRLGLNLHSPVVIYDDGALVDAARLFWTLEVYGLKNVKVLDVGFDSWAHHKLPIDSDTPSVIESDYVAKINDRRIATKLKTLIATKNPDQLVIDARGDDYYMGQKTTAKRSGHIPTALNYPASANLERSGNFLELQPVNALKNVYSSIPKDKKIVAYCSIGRIATANYLALRELGYDVSLYDASWNEWGNDFKLPIVNPAALPKQPEELQN